MVQHEPGAELHKKFRRVHGQAKVSRRHGRQEARSTSAAFGIQICPVACGKRVLKTVVGSIIQELRQLGLLQGGWPGRFQRQVLIDGEAGIEEANKASKKDSWSDDSHTKALSSLLQNSAVLVRELKYAAGAWRTEERRPRPP